MSRISVSTCLRDTRRRALGEVGERRETEQVARKYRHYHYVDDCCGRPADRARSAMIAAQNSLDELVESMTAVYRAGTQPSTVERVLQAARIDDTSLAPFLNFIPGRYTRNCIYRDERFELLVLCWSVGARSPIHDHGGSRCFVKIQRGSLTVDDYAIIAGGREPGYAHLAHVEAHRLNDGDLDVRKPRRDIHRVAAPHGDAVSLHVYAKPLDRCLIFDAAQRSCRDALSRYDNRPAG